MKFSKYISQQILFSSADNGDGEIRTLDPLLARQVLSQLSYAPILMGLSGLEPPTSRLSGVRSNRLSYKPIYITRLPVILIWKQLNQNSAAIAKLVDMPIISLYKNSLRDLFFKNAASTYSPVPSPVKYHRPSTS